jgi:hypothetical protein
VVFLGKGLNRGHIYEERITTHLVGGCEHEVPIGGEHRAGLVHRIERLSRHDLRSDLPEAKLERRDDAEIAPSAAQRPIEVGMVVCRRDNHLTVGEHHLRRDEVVDGEADGAGKVTDSATQSETGDTGA